MRMIVMSGLLALAGAANAGTPLPDGPHVVTSGEGKVSVAPDMARIVLSVSKRDAVAANAKQAVDAAVNGYLEVLKRNRISEADVSASAISLGEDFEWQNNRKVSRGFRGSRNVSVHLRDVSKLNALMDAGLAAGMNEIDSVTFESSNEDALRQEARRKAAAQSRERATELAMAYGATLGKIYSINSVASSLASRYGRGELATVTVTAMNAPGVVSAGQYIAPTIEFNESVQVVFDLLR
ncbi:MAG: SIMPL domain-containing protein [Xanthomonadales bacterium]|nr:SIMPL domain-containing protein [Xanthomonadales bacterium]